MRRFRLSRAKKELAHLEHRHALPERPGAEPQCYGEEGGGGRSELYFDDDAAQVKLRVGPTCRFV